MKIWLVSEYDLDKSANGVDYLAFGPNICMNLIECFPSEAYDIHENVDFGPNLYPSNMSKPDADTGAEIRSELAIFKGTHGFAALGKEIIGVLTPDEKVSLARMLAEDHPADVVFSEYSQSVVSRKRLNLEDIESLHEYASYRPWLSRREFGYSWRESPIVFIEKEYKYWISRGMTRAQLREADRGLAKKLDEWVFAGNIISSDFLPDRTAAAEQNESEITPAVRQAVLRADARVRALKRKFRQREARLE